jgi:hypothetical protein
MAFLDRIRLEGRIFYNLSQSLESWQFWDFRSKKAIASVGRVRYAGVEDKTEFAF